MFSSTKYRWLAAAILVGMFLAPAHTAQASQEMLEFSGDLNQIFIVGQEEPLAETGTPENALDEFSAGNLAGKRLSQAQAETMAIEDIILHGKFIYTTPFTTADGFGDGPYNSEEDFRAEGGRVGLLKAAPMQRINGLDAQTCLECHVVMRNSTVPAIFGIGGAGGIGANVIAKPSFIDVSGVSPATMDGRFINPLNNTGRGGMELLGKEMTASLQAIKAKAKSNPGRVFKLRTHGVYFGILSHDGAQFDYSGVEGIDHDLVVRPFGRKGEFISVRDFDLGAMKFHFGMEPTEEVGDFVDGDGDGVVGEILAGDMSALHIFVTNLPAPFINTADEEKFNLGFKQFKYMGCAGCHKPVLNTRTRELPYSFPEVPEEPYANVFMTTDLTEMAGFRPAGFGIAVPLFSDLKRHDMGEGLAESLSMPGMDEGEMAKFNREFKTAPLWGLRDTAPYLHDGRATTVLEAILAHGGEAQFARDRFVARSDLQKRALLYFLGSLRNPVIR